MKKVALIVIALLLLVSSGLAQKGGGGKPKPPPPPADPAIAFTQGGDLWVMNADGSNQTKVYDDPSNCMNRLSWSPDGQSIAFNRFCFPGPWELWRINVTVSGGVVQASPPMQLDQGDCGACIDPQWSPAGSEIAVGGGSSLPGLFVIPAGGGAAQVLYTPPAPGEIYWSAWSPDGSQIAFLEAGVGIQILDRNTGMVTPIPLDKSFDEIREMDWSREGSTLAISADEVIQGQFLDVDIYTVDVATGSSSLLIDNGDNPSWSPDDAKLVFSNGGRVGSGGVRIINLETGVVTKLASGASPDWRRCQPCP
ncbi:MAG: PD40 domain-containing protein [Acidobacteria bacterium]|nr:PD40 domain-containing protein [Acidobacteriota bacterium]